MKLFDIKKKAFEEKEENKIFFLTKDGTLIENNNLEYFKLKDLILNENGQKIIKMVEKEFYNKMKLIQNLRRLEKDADNGKFIDWMIEREIFKNIAFIAGDTIANAIKDDLIGNYNKETTGNENNEENQVENKKKVTQNT